MIQVGDNTNLTTPVEVSQARVKQLERYTNAFKDFQKRGDTHRCALCVNQIYRNKLFLETGDKNIYDYCKRTFNIGRGTVANYTTISKKFLDNNTGKSVFAHNGNDFSFIALIELKSLNADEVKDLIDKGVLTVDSSASECKAVVADYKVRQKEAVKRAKESSIQPLKEAYENFHTAFNKLKGIVQDNKEAMELMQNIMDSAVILYNENDRLWN